MKRLAPLVLVVLALAAVPAAFADDGPTPAAPATPPAATAPQHGGAHARLQLLRLELRVARLRYRIACHDASSDRCNRVTQTLVQRLTTLDGKVQQKLVALQCTTVSTDRKCVVLSKLDGKLKDVLQTLSSPPSP